MDPADNADVASIRIGERINKYIQIDHIMDKMRSNIKEQTDGDPEEIINLLYVNEATPYSSEAFAKSYILALEKAGFPEGISSLLNFLESK